MGRIFALLALFGFVTASYAQQLYGPLPKNNAGIRAGLFQQGIGIGDSWIAGVSNGASIFENAYQNYFPFLRVGNLAVAGTRSDQITTQIPTACATSATFALIDQGINDVAQSISEQTLENNEIINWNMLGGCGIQPIDMGMPPTNTAGNVPGYLLNEMWRSIYDYKHNIPKLDVYSALATNTGAFQSGLSQDAIHYNTVGSQIVSGIFASKVTSTSPFQPPVLAKTDTGSQFSSPFINSAVSFGGAGSTSLPSGWTQAGTACASLIVTAAASTDIAAPGNGQSFGNWMRCTISGAVSLSGFQPTAVSIASLGWSVGDTLAYGFCLRWSDSSQGLTITVSSSTQSGVSPIFQQKGGATGGNLCSYTQYVIPGGTVNMALQFQAIGTGYFEIKLPAVVNLTKLGQFNSLLP